MIQSEVLKVKKKLVYNEAKEFVNIVTSNLYCTVLYNAVSKTKVFVYIYIYTHTHN